MSDSKDYFDEVAQQWDEMREGFFSETIRDTAYEVADLQVGQTAADVGAGTGFMAAGLLEKGLKVIAIDQSPSMLETMQQKFSTYTNIEYRVGTAEQLPIEGKSLDYAFANMYLHHVESPPQAISEMARILKPGGKLIITDMDEHQFEFLAEEHHDRWPGFQRKDVQQWFKQAGLKNVHITYAGDNCGTQSTNSGQQADISVFVASGEM